MKPIMNAAKTKPQLILVYAATFSQLKLKSN